MSQHATIPAPHEITNFSLVLAPGQSITQAELLSRFESEQTRQRAGRQNLVSTVEATYKARPTLWDRFAAYVDRYPGRSLAALALAAFLVAALVGC